jgi:hypothetical protein
LLLGECLGLALGLLLGVARGRLPLAEPLEGAGHVLPAERRAPLLRLLSGLARSLGRGFALATCRLLLREGGQELLELCHALRLQLQSLGGVS